MVHPRHVDGTRAAQVRGPVVLGLHLSPHGSGHAFKTSLPVKAEAPLGPLGTRRRRPIVLLGSPLPASVDHPRHQSSHSSGWTSSAHWS